MKALVFHYKWPRIKEGLSYIEHDNWTDASKSPEGTFIHCSSGWFQRQRQYHSGGKAIAVYNIKIADSSVPKEIRALALILT